MTASLVRRPTASPWHVRASPGICRPCRSLPRQKRAAVCSLEKPSEPKPQQHQQRCRCLPQMPRLAAGCSAAIAALVFPHVPSWAVESLATMTDTSIDPGLGDSPPLLDTLLVVVITYFTVMLLYLWLSSFLSEDEGIQGSPDDGSKRASGDQSELPPGYGSFLDAHVRSYVTPGSKGVSALQDLGAAEPLEGEDLAHLKNRLAAGAAEALELQLRDCERLVRSKLLARKLGYRPTHAPDGPSSSGSIAGGGRLSNTRQIEEMMLTAVLTTPEGLTSWQHRAAVEALIDKHLDQVLPPGGGAFHEDLVVRQVMRRVVSALVMEESLLLLEGTDQAQKKLEHGGRGGKGQAGHNPWALW